MSNPQQNNNTFSKKPGNKMVPSITLSSFSSYSGNDKYFTLDVWNNKASFTFVDQSDKNNVLTLKFNLVLDRLMYLTGFVKYLYGTRIKNYKDGVPYLAIPEEKAFTVNTLKNGIQSPDPVIKVYTKEVNGVERVCIKGVDLGREIEIILGVENIINQCSDPDRIYKYDAVDIIIARFCQSIDNLPFFMTIYKFFVGFFEFFVGAIYRDKLGNKYPQKPIYGKNPPSDSNTIETFDNKGMANLGSNPLSQGDVNIIPNDDVNFDDEIN